MDELLDLSRIVHGKIVLDDEVIDAGVARRHGAIESLRLTAEQKRVALAFSDATSGGDARCGGIRLRLQQVVSNLIGNALKFTPRGRPRRRDAAVEAGWVVIDVADSGEGIIPRFSCRRCSSRSTRRPAAPRARTAASASGSPS